MNGNSINCVAMSSDGAQVFLVVHVGNARTSTLAKLFSSMSELNMALGGKGIHFRSIEDVNEKWQEGEPPYGEVESTWIVKTSGRFPEEVVVPNRSHTGVIKLSDSLQYGDGQIVQNITHHRVLTDEEYRFLIQ